MIEKGCIGRLIHQTKTSYCKRCSVKSDFSIRPRSDALLPVDVVFGNLRVKPEQTIWSTTLAEPVGGLHVARTIVPCEIGTAVIRCPRLQHQRSTGESFQRNGRKPAGNGTRRRAVPRIRGIDTQRCKRASPGYTLPCRFNRTYRREDNSRCLGKSLSRQQLQPVTTRRIIDEQLD